MNFDVREISEIKFKAYWNDSSYVGWSLPFTLNDIKNGQVLVDSDFLVYDALDRAEAVVQYIGLKDNTKDGGCEIYEGDILEDFSPTIEVRQVVVLDPNSVDFIFDQFGYKDFRELIARGRLRIIGNIFENPELIESGG